jgi:processive 1,2-diacylglycerol beta-glucosyltransferase
MNRSCKILFISAPIGAGHMRAAQSIQNSLTKQGRFPIECALANVFDFIHPKIGQTILAGYMKVLKRFPQVYGHMYKWGNHSELAFRGRDLISGYLAERMLKYIKRYNPAVIVCTHATPAGLAANLIKKRKLKMPVIAVVTDYVVHRLWVYPDIKHYIVANEALKRNLMGQGIAEESIHPIGIPVDESFAAAVALRKTLFGKFSLETGRKTVLVMGGGAGMLPMTDFLEAFDGIAKYVQVIFVAGKNRKMQEKLMAIKSHVSYPICIMGYIDYIAELMAVADVIVTKPGGMTSAEALSSGVPMVIYRPIPGQEEANAKELIRLGVARRAASVMQMREILEELLVTNPEALLALKQNAVYAGVPQAGARVAEYILTQAKMFASRETSR